MRTLYVSFFWPWPGQSGWGRRLSNSLEAMRSLGPVDFVCLDASDRPRDPAPHGIRVLDSPEGDPLPFRRWAPRWVMGHLPRQVVARDFETGAARIPDLIDGPYDAVVVPYIHAWPAIAPHLPPSSPVVLDLGDLVDDALRSRRRAGFDAQGATGVRRLAEWIRWHIVTLADRVDEGRFARLQSSAAERCALVFVCSELDIERSGLPNAVEIPNGCELPEKPRAATGVVDPEAPVYVFVGLYSYGPNVDAVRWFVDKVFPLVRQRIPRARFRVVGGPADTFSDLESVPGVEIVGWVPEVGPELTASDVVVVPIRYGSGTRLKVVEAMAHRVPMLSTSLGCEGIDVVDEEHILIADTAADFAEAAVALASDEDLRSRLVGAAEDLYLDRYVWSSIRETIAARIREVSGVPNDGG